MLRQNIIRISQLTIHDLKNIEQHLNKLSSHITSFGNDHKAISFYLDNKKFSANKKIIALFADIQSHAKILREQIVAQRKIKKDQFSQAVSKIVSLENINNLIVQELPNNLELLNKSEKNLNLLIQLVTLYHNLYVSRATEEKAELAAVEKRDLLTNDLYVLHVALLAKREEIQNQHTQTEVDKANRKIELEFQRVKFSYTENLSQDTREEYLLKKLKIKLDIVIQQIADKADELEMRSLKYRQKGSLVFANQSQADATTARELAQVLQNESAKIKKIPSTRVDRLVKLEQLKENCSQLIDAASESTLATRHYKWWKVVAANVLFCMTGIGLLISSMRWMATGNFLFFNKKDSAKKIMHVKDVTKEMMNVMHPG